MNTPETESHREDGTATITPDEYVKMLENSVRNLHKEKVELERKLAEVGANFAEVHQSLYELQINILGREVPNPASAITVAHHELRAKLSEAEVNWTKALEVSAEHFRDAQQFALEALSTQLASRRLREALSNLRDWAVANTTKPIHDLLAFTDFALSAPSDEQLIERVVKKADIIGHAIGCGQYATAQELLSQLLCDLKGADNE
jgi:hypothetical protein